MADSTILNLDLQTTGSNSGTWGTVTNENLQKLEQAIKGYVAVAISSTSQALTVESGGTGSSSEQANAAIKLTGTLSGDTILTCEAVEMWYIIDDATTHSGNSLTFKPAGGTGIALVQGAKHLVYTDGSTMFDVLNDAGNITANGTLAVTGDVTFNGGTLTYNSSGADKDAQFYGDGDNNLLYLNAGADTVGIGVSTPAAKLEIDQNSGTGAIPVLNLDQGDADQPFVDFVGTSAADSSSSISSSTAEAADKFGAVMIKINGTAKWIRVYDSAI